MFKRNFLKLDYQTQKLQICDEMGQLDVEIELRGKLRNLDTQLVNKLDPTFKNLSFSSYLKNKRATELTIGSVQLPSAEYPFALIFNDGEIIIIWTQSLEDFHKWTSRLQ